ncbi:FecR family protein [Tahibacter soli]|jgi:transmembrane sensor|uniref:FecR domain-containing protein n=1 Tax=Tahibacter soli TaxID=2983605 RepID=A0A9X3YHZ9_9GAMM|nr:FecR domain-containing protein [Tahibacter soli]MDC8011183.1 FecR domain-containing protein [Tahibacter soli]
MNTPESLQLEAARWHALAGEGSLSTAESARLDAWLARDVRHRLAYADVAAAGFALQQALGADAPLPAQAPRASRRPLLRWSLAAAPLLLLVALVAGPRVQPTVQNLRSDLHSAIGQPVTQTLADGSVLQLDTDSAVRIRMTPSRRDIELVRGRLAISVAKDPARPLHVLAGGTDAMAVGTRFVVDRGDRATHVGVQEGIVRVTRGDGKSAQLTAGQQVLVGDDVNFDVVELDVNADSWTRGVLSAERKPLVDVLAELDRYLPERIVLLDTAHAQMPITATLPLADPDAALRVLAQTSQLSLRHLPRVAYVVQ